MYSQDTDGNPETLRQELDPTRVWGASGAAPSRNTPLRPQTRGPPTRTILLPGGLSTHKTCVTQTLTVRVYEAFMDSRIGGEMIRTTPGGDPMKTVKMLTDAVGSESSSVFLGGPSNDFTFGMRRVTVTARIEGADTVLKLAETRNSGLIAVVVLVGLSFCLLPGVFFAMKTMMATKTHKGLLEQLQAEVLAAVPGSRLGA